MAYTDIDKPSDYFNTVLNSGDGTSPKSITGFNFQPDLVWTKTRTYGNNHTLFDSVRGAGSNKELSSNSTSAEGGVATGTYGYLSSFDTDGFTATSGSSGINYFNYSGDTYVNWGWLAGGTGVSNTDGSITSTVSANTTSGFSIVSYTGNYTAGATVGHGLGTVPAMYIIKNRDAVEPWMVYHQSLGNTKALYLNSTIAAATSASYTNNTSPTSSVFSLGGWEGNNGSGNNLIAYCFAEKKGFSKFGKYDGNAGVGAFVNNFQYLGFKPAFVMIKCYNAVESWNLFDNKRNGYNYQNNYLIPNTADAEVSAPNQGIDLLSNGFNPYYGTGTINSSGKSYIYMAFAENPFTTSTGIPTTAR